MAAGRDALLKALLEAKRSGGRMGLPAWTPGSMNEAYDVAGALTAGSETGPPIGWKIGATNGPAQAFLGISEPIRGRIFASGLRDSGVSVRHAPGLEAEPEIIFRLRDDVCAFACRTGEGARAAIAATHGGFEINRPRYESPFEAGVLAIVADNAAHEGLVIGPRIETGDDPASIEAVLRLNGEEAGKAEGRAVLGDPINALVWLAQSLPGDTALDGAWIATGGLCRSVALSPGDRLEAVFLPGGDAVLTVEAER
jgi:2-keto-4-pentenoate hydratase